jgi:hypothetical protein
MQVSQFFLIIACLLLFGSMIMNGWFTVTRGSYELQVDGTKLKLGKICNWWYFYWYKEKMLPDCIYYANRPLLNLYNSLKKDWPEAELILSMKAGIIKVQLPFLDVIPQVERKYKLNVSKKDIGDCMYELSFYVTETAYVFPRWLRHMLAGCITCFASLYGTIIFMTFHVVLNHTLENDIYAWASNPTIAFICTYLGCLLCWAFLNTALYKLIK